MDIIDLHIHSVHSDGTLEPFEIVDFARDNGIRAIALTDHDTVAGVTDAIEYGKKNNVKVISGIEIGSHVENRDIHILGYFFNVNHPTIQEYSKIIRKYREDRGRMILTKLGQLGVNIPWQLVMTKSNGGVIGRPHIADVLIEEGHVYSFRDAFDRYLGETGMAYVPKRLITPVDAINIIHEAGGIACIAHPGVDIPDEMIIELVENGLDGVEVFHPKHNGNQVKHYLELADKYDLLVTGGSDSHGTRMSQITIGSIPISCEYLSAMEKAHNVKISI